MHSGLNNTLSWGHYAHMAASVRKLPARTRAAVLLHDDSSVLANLLAARDRAVTLVLLNPGMRQAEQDELLAGVRPGILITDQGIKPAEGELEDASEDPVLLLVPTSATTGKAKIVALTRSGLDAMAWVGNRVFGLGPADTLLCLMPTFHLQGLLSSYQTLLAGGRVVMGQQMYRERGILPLLEEFQPTWYTGGPALHRAIVDEVRRAGGLRGRSPLRFIRAIGAALPPALLHEVEDTLEAPVIEGYGMTEAGTITSNPMPPGLRKSGSAGLPVECELRIAGDGEILVRSNSLMLGYRDNPQANAEALRDGWFSTGDLGRLDEDGYLWVTGRKKEMINRGGEKVLPGEVDAALLTHPAIAEAAAFPVPHVTLGEDVAAALVLREGAALTEKEIRHYLRERLSSFKIPERVIMVPSLPRSATGKAQRHVLSRLYAEAIQTGTLAPPRIASLWRAALEGRRSEGPVRVDENFFAAGGDSFALTTLVAAVGQEFGDLGDLAEFLEDPTPGGLARLVQDAAGTKDSPLLVLQSGLQGRIPLFCFPGADSDPLSFRHLSRALGPEQPLCVLQPGSAQIVEDDVTRLLEPLRRRQPHGPYFLLGHCYGGLVAFEMARRLEALGEEVSLVALVDTPTPGYPKVSRHWKRYLRQAFSRATTPRDVLQHLRWLALRLRPRPTPVQGTEIFQQKVEAARAYQPRLYSGRLCLILAAGEHHSTRVLQDSRLGWQDFAAGGSTVHRVPGGHTTILVQPHVNELANLLAPSLATAVAA